MKRKAIGTRIVRKKGGGINTLPNEMLHEIVKRLSPGSAAKFAQTSRLHRSVNDSYRRTLRNELLQNAYSDMLLNAKQLLFSLRKCHRLEDDVRKKDLLQYLINALSTFVALPRAT